MRVRVNEGNANAEWDDQDNSTTSTFTINGTVFQCQDQDLRDLYACLDFLFGRPRP